MKAGASNCNVKERVHWRLQIGTVGLLLTVLLLTTSCASLDSGKTTDVRTITSPDFVPFQRNVF